MNRGALFWIVLFFLSAACFFLVAAIVAVRGTFDLKDLLRTPRHQSEQTKNV